MIMNWIKITDKAPPKDGTEFLGARYNTSFSKWDKGVVKWTGSTFAVIPTRDFRLSLLPTHWAEIEDPT